MALAHEIRQAPVPVFAGCFSNSIPLIEYGYYKYQSSGWCAGICNGKRETVTGLSNGTQCWCGDLLPPAQSQVAKSRCDTPCQGYDLEDCGGSGGLLTVWLTGFQLNVSNYGLGGISSSSISSSSSTRTSTGRASTFTLARTKSAQGNQASSTASGAAATAPGKKSNIGHDKLLGIILGVVLGVVALVALLILLWWIRRRRKRRLSSTELQSTTETSSSFEGKGVKDTTVASGGEIDSERPLSTLGPLTLPPIVLRGPNLRTTTQTSTTTSIDQPFYTPSEGPNPFVHHGAAELSATSLPEVADATRDTASEPTHESSEQRLSTSTAPHQTIFPYATPRESDGISYNDPSTSEAGEVIEDTGIGFTSINTAPTTPPVSQVLPGTSFYDSNLTGDSVEKSNTTLSHEASNGGTRVGSLLVATRDFTARSSDEISMAKGDRIVLVEKDDQYEDGWFIGQNTANGMIGLFPEVYTTRNV